MRSAEADDVIFENRSAADFRVREHRKRRKSRQASGRVAFTGRLSDFSEVVVQLVDVAGGNGEVFGEHRAD